MNSPVPGNSINDQALHWAVEKAYGEMSPESRAELQAWLAADTRHRGAFVRAQAWMRATEDAVVQAQAAPLAAASADVPPTAEAVAPQPSRRGRLGHRGWAVGGSAIAASVVALILAGGLWRAPPKPGAQVAAPTVMALEDGSIATLSGNAEIQVALSDDARRITLLSGEAKFQVAKDKARPFVVRSGEIFAQATGTVYSVRRVGTAGATVKVQEGSVLVWPRDERDQAVLVQAGGMATLDPGPERAAQAKPAATRLPPPELAQISLDNVPISAAVARFNRVNSTKIVIADAAIGEVTMIGLFDANDPKAFARAVAAITGARVEYRSDGIVIKL